MGRSKTSKKLSYKDLEKVFGIDSMTISWRIRKSGMGLKEALETPPNSYIKDLTGQRFGKLVAQYVLPESCHGNRKWHCLCDCGNERDVLQSNLTSGKQKSCGCLTDEMLRKRIKSMTGKIINNILIKERVENEIDKNGKEHVRYLCECPSCHSDFIARIENIKSGNTKGCGCSHHISHNFIDLTGKDFEFCHVDKRAPNRLHPGGGQSVMYECTCCCGKKYISWAATIKNGRSNCGCKRIKSKGELTIYNILKEKNIPFIDQYYFDDLRGKRKMPYFFDFALFDNEENLLGLIEYQGEQHYHECNKSIKDFGKHTREISDPAKKKYCIKNNISLYEIRYDENIQISLNKILDLLYYDNTVPSSQKTA